MTEADLTFRCDRLEIYLAALRCPVRVTGADVTRTMVRYHVLPAPGLRYDTLAARTHDMALALMVDQVRVERSGAGVIIETRRPDARPVYLTQLEAATRGERRPMTAILGLADDGEPLGVYLPSPNVAHILIAGTTGSGKTQLMRSIIMSLCLPSPRLGLVLIDPRQGAAFGCFGRLPFLMCPIAHSVEQAERALGYLVNDMAARDAQPTGDYRVVVIDELADLLTQDQSGAILGYLQRLTQRGRNCGMHVIAATIKPTAEVVGGLVKSNFPTRLVGHVTSADDARVATGMSGSGAERLAGRGDFLMICAGQTRRFQAAMVSDMDVDALCTRLGWVALPPELPAPVAPEGVITGDAPVEQVETAAELAERLRPWWIEHGGEYGSKSAAIRFLWPDNPYVGGDHWERMEEAVRIIDSSTPTSTPPRTPRSPKIIPFAPRPG
jgi:S-DNA-T family DNA segregation ATPase FtsK/SpoIIIE